MVQTNTIDFTRFQQLQNELLYALNNTEKKELKQWAKRTALVFPKVTVRRVKNIVGFIGITAIGTAVESKKFIKAGLERKLYSHAKQRADDLSIFTLESYQNIKELSKSIKNMLIVNPKKTGIQMFLAFMGFNLGGVDLMQTAVYLIWTCSFQLVITAQSSLIPSCQ